MPPVNVILLIASSMLAGALLLIGYWIGRSRTQAAEAPAPVPVVGEEERQRLVSLLQSLSRWTNEYSGNVSNYQSDLQQISQDVRQNLSMAQREHHAGTVGRGGAIGRGEAPGLDDARMMTFITQVMSTNEALQTRLNSAEKQLAQQTQQIESYLTEARTDALTGLFNRRAFDQLLDELFAQYRNGGSSFVLIIADIDHFKKINDTHGHPVGDLVLQRIASRLGEGMSDAKIVARFGGEEFAILTDAPLRIAAERINKLRRQIANEAIQAGRESIRITMSVGLTQPRDELVVGPIVRRADEALYCAKNRGRNRVYFDAGVGPQLVGAPEPLRDTVP